jgi:hypothetical protein
VRRFICIAAFCALLFPASSFAQTPAFPFTFYIHDTTGQNPDTPLPSIYQFGATAVGGYTNIVLKAVNTSTSTVYLGTVYAALTNGGAQLNTNFSITGLYQDVSLPPGGSVVFTVNFDPAATGLTTAYLQTSYQVQQNSCNFTSTTPATQCPGGTALVSTMNATGTQPQLVLSYPDPSGSGTVTLQPSSATPIEFGNVSLSSSASITFTLSNKSAITLSTPAISVPAPTTFASNPYSLDISKVPSSLAAGASATFVVTFSPGQTGVVSTTLLLGSDSYKLHGDGIVVANIDALQVSYVDSTGVVGLPQAATPISFGQLVAGVSTPASLTFTVTNPTTSYNAVTVPSLTVTGSNFTLSALTGVSSFPASVAPGSSFSFVITFSPSASGTSTGTLAIGARAFSLTGLTVTSPLPGISFQVTPSLLSSQLQGTIAVQLATASTVSVVGTLSMSFTPSVASITSDPAIMFLANSGQQISVSVAAGQLLATYNGQSALSFQTGTTAGTLTFSVTFPNTPVYTKSFTIPPAVPQLTSVTAVRSSPNLVVTVNGYDNTYTAGNLGFTFYDTQGNTITPIQLNATSQFQQLFYTNNTAGGAFSFQATFPVTGNVTRVGSVLVSVTNSAGQATSTVNFQ